MLDHYATEAYEVGEEVLDGYDTYTDYEDNGDGTFTEVTWEEPRYRTEYHTEYREVPVDRQEPVYDTMYDYDIERWVHARDETVRGAGFAATDSTLRDLEVAEPYWPETRLGGNERDIAHTIVNALAITSGIVCDGAKSSCAAKIATAVETGIFGYEMYRNGQQFYAGDGLVVKGVENSIENFGRLARIGMRGTDEEIIHMMTEER